MGIPGFFKEIGKGDRIALSRLGVAHLEKHNRPFRIAIDAAIWNFQTQHGGVGGKNPALRTLFYRLVKLLALPIYPVFVYDGRNKPLCKRGRTVSRWHGGTIPEQASRKLISLFSFPCHIAPGEAEAECAMLQSHGIVDAVMTQDVDAIMFGSGLTLRDWSKEGKAKGNGAPTHVSVFDLEKLKEISGGLDPDGMILVALLSGGDYDEDGVPGIGISLACDIARAGFGSDLLELVRNGDDDGIQEWRERLQYELETNESGYFKMKRKSVQIPEAFPNRTIMDYYMNPAVTEEGELKELERKWMTVWEDELEIQALRDYTANTLDWQYKPGAWHFVRNIAPALLADLLQRGTAASFVTSDDQITERRHHFASGGMSELRVTVVPADVVGLDLDAEEDSPKYLERLAAAEGDEDADEQEIGGDDEADPSSPAKTRKKAPWLPWNPEKLWIAETIVQLGAREHVERWNQIQWALQNDAKKFATRKCSKKKMKPQKAKNTSGMQAGALHRYIGAVDSFSKPADSITTSSNTASKTISDLLASAEESLLPSPTRPKANTKARRRIRTPTKQRSVQMAQDSSPLMLNRFRSTKGGQETRLAQEIVPSSLNPLTKLIEAGFTRDEDSFMMSESQAGKHSRSSTSSSADPVRRVPKKSAQLRAKDTRSVLPAASPPPHEAEPVSEAPLLTTSDVDAYDHTLLQEQIPRPSPSAETGVSIAAMATQVPIPEAMLSNVTKRTPRQRAKKGQASLEVQPSSPSPVRLKRPIQDFFRPYLKPWEPHASSVLVAASSQATDLIAVPPELTTGPRTTLTMATHMHAIPRSSLPGTWKEAECKSGPNSQAVLAEAYRPPRVSIVDLTAD